MSKLVFLGFALVLVATRSFAQEPGEESGLPVGDESGSMVVFTEGESEPVDDSLEARRQRRLTEVVASSFRDTGYPNGVMIKVGAQNLGRMESVSNVSSRDDVKAEVMRVLRENDELFAIPADDMDIVVDEFSIASDEAKVSGRFRRSHINFHQIVNGIPVADSTITLADDRVSYLRLHVVDPNDNAFDPEAMLEDEVLRELAVDEYSRQVDNKGELQLQTSRLVILDDPRSGSYIVVYELAINSSVVRLSALDGTLYDFERGMAY